LTLISNESFSDDNGSVIAPGQVSMEANRNMSEDKYGHSRGQPDFHQYISIAH
jgi:hypothetical protein